MRTLAALILAVSAPAFSAAPGSASAAVQASNEKVRAALNAYFKSTGPAKAKARAEARNAVGALLDFQAIARATMGKHWAELTPAQRARYTEALRRAMEANYLSKMQQGQVDVSQIRNEILGEEKRGDKVLVKTRVTAGKDTAEVDYLMERGKSGWRAVDVITEGASLVDTYKEQVSRLLPKKGVEGVIQALERARKRAEEEQPKQAAAPASPR